MYIISSFLLCPTHSSKAVQGTNNLVEHRVKRKKSFFSISFMQKLEYLFLRQSHLCDRPLLTYVWAGQLQFPASEVGCGTDWSQLWSLKKYKSKQAYVKRNTVCWIEIRIGENVFDLANACGCNGRNGLAGSGFVWNTC